MILPNSFHQNRPSFTITLIFSFFTSSIIKEGKIIYRLKTQIWLLETIRKSIPPQQNFRNCLGTIKTAAITRLIADIFSATSLKLQLIFVQRVV